jgi:hypothetical protein
MAKHKEVTVDDRAEIARIVAEHRADSNDFLLGIKEAEAYLKNHVEDSGLFSFASSALGGMPCTPVEHIIAGPIFIELNQKPLAVDLLGIGHSHEWQELSTH